LLLFISREGTWQSDAGSQLRSPGAACVKRQNGFRRAMTRKKSRATRKATYSSLPILTEQRLHSWTKPREQKTFACLCLVELVNCWHNGRAFPPPINSPVC